MIERVSVPNQPDIYKFESVLCASVLHDTLEDTETSFEELVEHFGEFTAKIVSELSNDSKRVRELTEEKYGLYKKGQLDQATQHLVDGLNSVIDDLDVDILQKRIGRGAYFIEKMNKMSLEALLVKLSDRLDNVSDGPLDKPSSASSEKPKKKNFNLEYQYETRYVMDNLDKTRLTPLHEELISLIRAVVF